ncbi:cAMP-dependent protein kinase inhibitor alpha-like isoform X1 [Mya arenaria]|uniref:cAMP-dependent protein kinase inhibitor alpha-like isoform X1 n=1 Tax=Mya arenaria TaxID=6604 RepID=UPI0022E64E84|nr:cAMP-dependent protein kinase inhibitor alpha-like isoform X1 [Mya arenaria]XP_052763154.1 cAMP-dependent protein kinase inhibitor alpha-like isoform X1 [Mya arenaria]
MEQTGSKAEGTPPPGTDMDPTQSLEEFIASGRTGRRNAMPDILHSNHAGVGTGGLAEDMEKLNCSDAGQGGSTQNSQQVQPGQSS